MVGVKTAPDPIAVFQMESDENGCVSRSRQAPRACVDGVKVVAVVKHTPTKNVAAPLCSQVIFSWFVWSTKGGGN